MRITVSTIRSLTHRPDPPNTSSITLVPGHNRQYHLSRAIVGFLLAPVGSLGLPEVCMSNDEVGCGLRYQRHEPRSTCDRNAPHRWVVRLAGSPRSRYRAGFLPRVRAALVAAEPAPGRARTGSTAVRNPLHGANHHGRVRYRLQWTNSRGPRTSVGTRVSHRGEV